MQKTVETQTAATQLMQNITTLRGVGARMAEKFAKLGIVRVQDLVFHLPLRYQDRSRLWALGELEAGREALTEGLVIESKIVMRGRRALLVTISDGSASLLLRFFYFSNAQQQGFAVGQKVRVYGEVRQTFAPQQIGTNPIAYVEIIHPEYKIINAGDAPELNASLTPIYPSTQGLNQNSIRRLIKLALDIFMQSDQDELQAILPANLQFSLGQALQIAHHPPVEIAPQMLQTGAHPAIARLAFEELLAQQLVVRQARTEIQKSRANILGAPCTLLKQFIGNLPFRLTGAQQRVIDELLADTNSATPALRLVQGDVGSGKTVVAAALALQAVGNGLQAAILAPTELLAEQHFANMQIWCKALGVELGWLSGKVLGKARTQALAAIKSGAAQIVIGTHALFQAEVEFANLALLVVDEQHRFGVGQRLALREKALASGKSPHQIIMTATPIPRSLAMTSYADLDISIIDELPKGRLPITTVVMSEQRREGLVERIATACAGGAQAYWVCTLIDESPVLQCQAAEQSASELQTKLPNLKVALVHGRMKSSEKNAIMAEFKAGNIQVLVATTVIEVGVDVANASLMIIENAERLGLAQLHQLRGRVGRGSKQSSCVLLYKAPLGKIAKQRLEVMRSCHDGFQIAQFDLELRGAGEFLGTRQTGEPVFRVADLLRDSDMLDAVQQTAAKLPAHLASLLINRWVGAGQNFSQV